MEITHAYQADRRPAVDIEGLTKRFGDRIAVDGVSLTVPRGVAYGFLGHNGAGKTTLIRMLLGLTRASAGRASVLGLPVPAQRARALARVGAIVEEPSFYSHLTGYENLKIAAAVRGPETRKRIDGVLERVGLDRRSGDRVGTYSLGMRQRLGVARCLLSDPELLILDEPMNGLDPGGMLDVRRMIRALVEDEGRTVFVSSHLLDEVEKTCDVAAIIDGGRVIAQGSIEDLVADEADELVIECDDADRALALLAGDPAVRELRAEHGARADEAARPRPGGRDQLAPGRRRPGGISARAGAPESRGPVPGDDNTAGGGRMTLDLTVARQMVGADLLRLRKKRGMIALALAVVLVPLVIMTGYDVVKHASDPAHYPPAGGLNNYGRLLDLLGVFMGPVAAILIGAEAGAGDLAAGVFRDNVLTGRSRTALFLARIPAAVAVTLSGHGDRVRDRSRGHIRFRRRAGDAEPVGHPGVGGVARARELRPVRDRAGSGVPDRLTAGDDHRVNRVGARVEPVGRPGDIARHAQARPPRKRADVPQARPSDRPAGDTDAGRGGRRGDDRMAAGPTRARGMADANPGRLRSGVTLSACDRCPQRRRRYATRSAAILGGAIRCWR